MMAALLRSLAILAACIQLALALRPITQHQWGLTRKEPSLLLPDKLQHYNELVVKLRAGAEDEEEEDEDEEEDDEEDEEEDEEEEEEEEEGDDEEEDEEDEEDDDDEATTMAAGAATAAGSSDVEEYDELIRPPGSMQLYTMVGLFLIFQRINSKSPKVVLVGRIIFLSYIVFQQLFLLFVRIRAKLIDDQTPVTMTNAISKLLGSQAAAAGGGGANDMVKSLLANTLQSSSTVRDYDTQQAKSQQGGLIVNMALMWFLHFKMGQVEPLFFQSLQGFLNLAYSPLFQVYVLGRNLKRPFAPPPSPLLNQLQQEGGDEAKEAESDAEMIAEETNAEEEEEEEEAASDDDDDDDDEEDDDGEEEETEEAKEEDGNHDDEEEEEDEEEDE